MPTNMWTLWVLHEDVAESHWGSSQTQRCWKKAILREAHDFWGAWRPLQLESLQLKCSTNSSKQEWTDCKTKSTGPHKMSLTEPYAKFLLASVFGNSGDRCSVFRAMSLFQTSRSHVALITEHRNRTATIFLLEHHLCPMLSNQVFKWLVRDSKYVISAYPGLLSIATNNWSQNSGLYNYLIFFPRNLDLGSIETQNETTFKLWLDHRRWQLLINLQ